MSFFFSAASDEPAPADPDVGNELEALTGGRPVQTLLPLPFQFKLFKWSLLSIWQISEWDLARDEDLEVK